ncbi:MAG: hypothetical protein ACRDLK_07760 [Gaiellaceae bacterium]
MRKLLERLLRRPPAPVPESEQQRLLRIYRQTLAEVQDLRRAA